MPSGFSFDFKTIQTSLGRQIAELFQSQLAAVGIKMNIIQEDFTRLLSDSENHDFQACAIGWSGRPDPDQNAFIWFHSTGSFNDARYSNPDVDKLLEQARAASATSDRVKLYQQAVRQIVSDAPYQFTTAFPNGFVWNSTVKGFSPIPDGMVRTTRMYKG